MKDNNKSMNSSNNDSGFLDMSIEDSLLLTSDQERQTLCDLNNRFAKYVEHIRNQDEGNKTARSIEKLSEIPSIQLANLRELFEGEINSLRNTLDNQSNDMAKLRVAHDKLMAENDNQVTEILDKSRIVNQLTDNLRQSKSECETLRTKMSLLKNKENEALDLSSRLKECQNQLEMEVLLRTSADNACLTYKEKMEFNEAVFKKELGALMTTHKKAITKLTSLQQTVVSSNILEQMEEARKRLKNYLDEIRCSIDENFLKRIETTTTLLSNSFRQYSNIAKNNGTLSSENTELLSELAKLKASHVRLEDQLSNLESLHGEEISKLYRTISEISSSQIDDLDERLRSLQDLNQSLSTKDRLDTEIILYRKMIESEEDRTRCRSLSGSPPDSKKRKINNIQISATAASEAQTNRPVLRASRQNKSCSIM